MINRNFVNIYGNVGNNIQDTSTNMQTIIKTYCNDIYFDILRRTNWEQVNDNFTINTVAGQSDYPLPADFGKEIYVYNATQLKQLPPIDMQELVRDYADGINSQGEVQRYLIVEKPVRNQPSSASTLSLVSSSASDSTQSVRIKGIDSNSIEIEETVTLTGTTPVATTNSYSGIKAIGKSATTTGTITITSNSGAVTVAMLAPADIAYKVRCLRAHYTPTGVITLSVPYVINPYPLSSDYDQPVFDCADVIELGATMKAWRYKRQMAKANEYERQYERALDTLIWNKENQLSRPHLMGILPQDRDNY